MTGPRLTLPLVLATLAGCALLQVAPLERASLLSPKEEQRQDYATGEDGAVAYRTDDFELVVEPMSDAALNRLFPQESTLGEYSINPYTFGDWVDPNVGYVPNRFTVFRITVHNRGLAKVELDPLRAVLTTDRPGEVLSSYGILAGAAPRTFEGYYRARRRPSGNEYYRFSMRMGIVRSNNYAVEKKIFAGESYGGFIVFDPLDDEVRSVRLTLRDFTLKFNAFDMPLDGIDLIYDFDRHLLEGEIAAKISVGERSWSTARLRSATQVHGNATGDTNRDGGAIDARVEGSLETLNTCFGSEFKAGRAAEGQVDARYTIDAAGAVTSAEVTRSTVVSPAVGECVQRQIEAWQFGPSSIPADLQPADGSGAYIVTAVTHLEFLDAREAW